VYVRQSSQGQVVHNQESQRRQYGLADPARELGFQEVVVIDEDLGRSGSGLIERPGFQRLVAEVCTREVGAVFCIEASRLAWNGRDWALRLDIFTLDPFQFLALTRGQAGPLAGISLGLAHPSAQRFGSDPELLTD